MKPDEFARTLKKHANANVLVISQHENTWLGIRQIFEVPIAVLVGHRLGTAMKAGWFHND